MRGAVGGRFNVLGGLVKGECCFEFEIGEQCEIIRIFVNNNSMDLVNIACLE